jgi:heme/copper-type cytochrome/quinol oxidase subunit 2
MPRRSKIGRRRILWCDAAAVLLASQKTLATKKQVTASDEKDDASFRMQHLYLYIGILYFVLFVFIYFVICRNKIL